MLLRNVCEETPYLLLKIEAVCPSKRLRKDAIFTAEDGGCMLLRNVCEETPYLLLKMEAVCSFETSAKRRHIYC